MECGHCTGLIKRDIFTGQKWVIIKNGLEFNSFIRLTNLETGETVDTYKTDGCHKKTSPNCFERYVSEAKYNQLKTEQERKRRESENL